MSSSSTRSKDSRERLRPSGSQQQQQQPTPILVNSNTRKYLSPNEVEATSLDRQHRKNVLALGSLYPCPELVRAALEPDPTRKKAILDLGWCSSGVWAAEVALENPHVLVLGLDIVPHKIKTVPPNCQFDLQDINLGLSKYYNMFDVVHMRNVAPTLRNFADSVQEAVKCLRPGGVFLVVEGDFELYRDVVHFQEPNTTKFPRGSWAAKHMYEVRDGMSKRGSDLLGASACLDGGLWGYPGFDEDSLGVMSLYTPLGTWPESPNPQEHALLNQIGGIQGDFWRRFADDSRLALVHTGTPGEFIDQLVDRSVEEIENPDRYRLWVRTRYCWGRRLLADGTPARGVRHDKTGYAPLPPGEETPPSSRKNSATATTSAGEGDIPPIYHMKHYYFTKDALRLWADWRRRERKRIGMKALPPSIPWESILAQD